MPRGKDAVASRNGVRRFGGKRGLEARSRCLRRKRRVQRATSGARRTTQEWQGPVACVCRLKRRRETGRAASEDAAHSPRHRPCKERSRAEVLTPRAQGAAVAGRFWTSADFASRSSFLPKQRGFSRRTFVFVALASSVRGDSRALRPAVRTAEAADWKMSPPPLFQERKARALLLPLSREERKKRPLSPSRPSPRCSKGACHKKIRAKRPERSMWGEA